MENDNHSLILLFSMLLKLCRPCQIGIIVLKSSFAVVGGSGVVVLVRKAHPIFVLRLAVLE